MTTTIDPTTLRHHHCLIQELLCGQVQRILRSECVEPSGAKDLSCSHSRLGVGVDFPCGGSGTWSGSTWGNGNWYVGCLLLLLVSVERPCRI
jgi:hypothetical protein